MRPSIIEKASGNRIQLISRSIIPHKIYVVLPAGLTTIRAGHRREPQLRRTHRFVHSGQAILFALQRAAVRVIVKQPYERKVEINSVKLRENLVTQPRPSPNEEIMSI
jgi:hypothetical protein